MLTLAMVILTQAATLSTTQSATPGGVTKLTIVADYPHLLFPQEARVRKAIVKAYGSSSRPKWKDIVAAQNLGLQDIQKETRATKKDRVTGEPIGTTDLYLARRYAKSDPAPTQLVISNLADSVAKLLRMMSQLDPKDVNRPDIDSVAIKVLVLVEWRAGWCDGEFDTSGLWVPEQKGCMFSGAVPLETGVDMSNKEAVKRLVKSFSKKAGKEPLAQPWIAAFRDPKTGKVGDRELHLQKLVSWWAVRTNAIKRLLADRLPQYRDLPDRLRVEVRAYDPVRVNEGTKKRALPGNQKAVVWLSQSGVRDDWGGLRMPMSRKELALAKKKNLTYEDALSLIRSNFGSWPTNQHRLKFCEKAQIGAGGATRLVDVLRVQEPREWLRKPLRRRKALPYYPETLVPVQLEGDLRKSWVQEFERRKLRNRSRQIDPIPWR